MSKALIKSAFTVGLLVMLMAVPVYGASVNKSIRIDAGSEADGATTVNGSISASWLAPSPGGRPSRASGCLSG